MDASQAERGRIQARLGALNAAWLEGHPERLAEFFHPEIVMAAPGFEGRLEGVEAGVESYAAFVRGAEVRAFDTENLSIDVWGSTAVASYRFTITYEKDGETRQDEGWDLFVFAHDGEDWQAVWRTIVPAAED